MKKLIEVVGTAGVIVGFIGLVVGLLLVSPFLFMIAWNYVAPVFWKAAPHLTFMQSLAVVVISRIALKASATVNNKKTE